MFNRVIAIDLDKTLLKNDGGISQYTLSILESCSKKNIAIAIVTARSYYRARQYLSLIKPQIAILNAGAIGLYCNKIIYKATISVAKAKLIIDRLTEDINVEKISVETNRYLLCNFKDYLSWEGYNHAKFSNLSQLGADEIFKINYELKEKCNFENWFANLDVRIMNYGRDRWIRVTDKNANKILALSEAIKYTHNTLMDCIGFGDDYDDKEVIVNCGVGVAVGNAIDEIKDVADAVCENNEDDGVAKWIDQNLISCKGPSS